MKKLLAALLIACAALTLCSCGGDDSFKVGVILVGDATEGYTKAHIDGINQAVKNLGLSADQVIWKEKVEEDDKCATAARELVAEGCKIIFSNSYGHQDYMYQVAKENKDVTFVACTGDYAAISGLTNYKNAFTDVYESRYVSGIVAGLKLKELADGGKLTDANKDADGNWKIGYVGAFKYAEVVSGYTAFFQGVKSVITNVSMDVQFTSSWFNIDEEAKAAELLVGRGCVIIGQHADSTGAPSKVESLLNGGKVCYSVGYNVDMLGVAPHAALTSATNNWGVYYTYAIGAAKKGENVKVDWAEGYKSDAVAITKLGASVATGTEKAVNDAIAAIKAETLHVFDCSKFTVNKKNVTTNVVDFTCMDYSTMTVRFAGEKKETVKTAGTVSYIDESTFRSAPYFSINVDGITWLN